jgi:Leucine-rich repeat (LRR) protein
VSIKVIGETLKLSEFGNQRFLYGNFLPAFYGIMVLTTVIFKTNPLSVDSITLILFLSLIALICAFFTQKASRIAIYKIIKIEDVYINFFDIEFLEKRGGTFLTNIQEQLGDRSGLNHENANEIKGIIRNLSLEDFKAIYNDYFYSPPTSLKSQELWRKETLFLLGFWGMFWSICCGICTIVVYEEFLTDFSLFFDLVPVDHYLVIIIFNLLILLPLCIFLLVTTKSDVQTLLLSAFPVYPRKEDLRSEANSLVIQEMITKYKEEKIALLTLFYKELEPEIRSDIRKRYDEQSTLVRVKKRVSDQLGWTEWGDAILGSLEKERILGKSVIQAESKVILKLMEENGWNTPPNLQTDENGNIFSLFIPSKNLKRFPEIIEQLDHLKFLYLNNNLLTDLPDIVGNFGKLQLFDISYNSLKNIPKSIGNLITLETLRLENNQLKIIPETLKSLKKLKHLDLRNNELQEIPLVLKSLPQLQVLDLTGNKRLGSKAKVWKETNLKKLIADI